MTGPRSSARFTLQELLDSDPAPSAGVRSASYDLRPLAHKEYRIPIPGVRPVRLPKDVSALSQWLDGAAGYAALTSPAFVVPLTAGAGSRRVALIGLVDGGDQQTVVVARLEIAPGPTRHAPPLIAGYDVRVATGRDAISDLIEEMWLDADPAAQNQGADGIALWLSADLSQSQPDGERRISAIGAVYGYRFEFGRDASRYVKEIKSRLGAAPPAAVIVWEPHGHGLDSALESYRGASADGDILQLAEYDFDDALVELRWGLADLTSIDESSVPATDSGVPKPGDERYYVKVRGSGAGDVMREVTDCGHNQWGSDQRRTAPRADKGLAATVGARARSLHLCAKCSKHRWRARF